MQIPEQIDYLSIDGLSNELRQKLDQQRPASLARAARIPGMTPAALSVLLIHAKKSGGPLNAQYDQLRGYPGVRFNYYRSSGPTVSGLCCPDRKMEPQH